MASLLILLVLTVLVALVLVPSLVASAKRKRAGDTSEVLLSSWQDWGLDDPEFPGRSVALLASADPEEIPEPAYGVIQIQAR